MMGKKRNIEREGEVEGQRKKKERDGEGERKNKERERESEREMNKRQKGRGQKKVSFQIELKSSHFAQDFLLTTLRDFLQVCG